MKDLDRAEMTLVRMLTETRNWADHMTIVEAIQNLREHARSMVEEQNRGPNSPSGAMIAMAER